MNPKSKISKTTAVNLLTTSVNAIPEIDQHSTNSPEFVEWRRNAETSIIQIFGSEGRHLKEFQRISYTPLMIVLNDDSTGSFRRAYLTGLDKAKAILRSMIREIEKFWEEDEQMPDVPQLPSDSAISKTNSIFQENQFSTQQHMAFMLSPFGNPFDTIFENHIKPTIKNTHELICVRADNIYDNQPVIDDIWRLINEAKIIIADLTNKNPNVFYETGLAHAIGKEVILIAQTINDVPFDLRHRRCIIYQYTPEGINQLKYDLKNTITNVISRMIPPIRLNSLDSLLPSSKPTTQPAQGGLTIPCPFCAEPIRKHAVLCRYCGSKISQTTPPTTPTHPTP